VLAFGVYALVIFTLTHWPRLTIPETGLERTDIYVHLLVFTGWAGLLNIAEIFGPLWSPRAIVLRAATCVVYVCFDEGTQALPFVQRDARWDDLAANLTGVALAFAALGGVAALRPGPRGQPPRRTV
jgi:hypothetical protein